MVSIIQYFTLLIYFCNRFIKAKYPNLDIVAGNVVVTNIHLYIDLKIFVFNYNDKVLNVIYFL